MCYAAALAALRALARREILRAAFFQWMTPLVAAFCSDALALFTGISLDGGANRFHHILDAGLDGTIASSALHALLMTLDSRLVVGHDFPPGYVLLRPRRGVVAV